VYIQYLWPFRPMPCFYGPPPPEYPQKDVDVDVDRVYERRLKASMPAS